MIRLSYLWGLLLLGLELTSFLQAFVVPPTLSAQRQSNILSYNALQMSSSTAATKTTTTATSSFEKMTVAELKNELKNRGLPVSGVKAALIERLVEAETTSTEEDFDDFDIIDNDDDDDDQGFDIDNDGISIDDDISIEGDDDGFVLDEEEEEEEDDDEGFEIDDDDDTVDKVNNKNDDDDDDDSNLSVIDLLPPPIIRTLTKRTTTSVDTSKVEGGGEEEQEKATPVLLPVQEKSFRPIASGSDAVLFAPTGSGKTLGYTLPLMSRLFQWKRSGAVKKRERVSQKEYFLNREPACPSILILAPSRELAKQVGRVVSQYHPTSPGRVASVFGGVPIERHISLLRRDLDIIVGTPGRVRELIREGHLSTSYVKSIVLDEADVLLNFDDQPEIEMLLDGMEEDYQLVLASATVNQRVKDFVYEVMEMEDTDDAFINIRPEEAGIQGSKSQQSGSDRPTVSHWSISSGYFARTGVAADLIATLAPRIGIIFVASKVEADTVGEDLAVALPDTKVSVLHGDMSQSARTRVIANLRKNDGDETIGRSKVLVATDVASRGLDLRGIDLVLQFGIPKMNGKDGTYDYELYLHRAGRAGRFGGGSKSADAILLYDPSEGEGRLLPDLAKKLNRVGVQIEPRSLPAPAEVMEASFHRAQRMSKVASQDEDFLQFFRSRLESNLPEIGSAEREEVLMEQLAAAMAALSGLEGIVEPRSLLTSDSRDRTLRVWSKTDDGEPLTPPRVTKFVKQLGSGKLGRVTICSDGSAVFDLPLKRALRVMNAFQDDEEGVAADSDLDLEMPTEITL